MQQTGRSYCRLQRAFTARKLQILIFQCETCCRLAKVGLDTADKEPSKVRQSRTSPSSLMLDFVTPSDANDSYLRLASRTLTAEMFEKSKPLNVAPVFRSCASSHRGDPRGRFLPPAPREASLPLQGRRDPPARAGFSRRAHQGGGLRRHYSLVQHQNCLGKLMNL